MHKIYVPDHSHPLRSWLVAIIMLMSLTMHAQVPAWQMMATTTPSLNATPEVLASAADASGNVYVAGRFASTLDVAGTPLTAQGYDIFLAKWSPARNAFAWVQRVGSGGNDAPVQLVVSGSTIYLAGNLGGGTANFGSLALSNATAGPFVARFADTGTAASFAWVWQPASPFFGTLKALAVSGSSLYIAGSFTDASVTLGSTVLQNMASPNTISADAFVAKLTDTGSSAGVAWALRAGGSDGDEATALAVSGSSVYVAGNFNSTTADFGSHILNGTAYYYLFSDVFVAKITDAASPSFTWATPAGGLSDEKATALAVSGSSVYVAGTFAGLADFGATSLTLTSPNAGVDAFVAKLTDAGTAGSYVWAKQAGGTSDDNATALAVNGSSVYVTGQFGFMGASFGTFSLTNAGTYGDVYVAKLLDAGNSSSFAWAQRGGGAGNDYTRTLTLAGQLVYIGGASTTPTAFGTHTVAEADNTFAPVGFLAAVSDAPSAPVLSSVAPTNGLPGEVISLTGTNLTGTSAIRFAGTGTPTVTSGFSVNAAGTLITGVVIPSGAATGYLTATTPVGTSNGLSFVISPTPPAWQMALSAVPTVSGGNYGSTVQAIATDASGNVYIAGRLNNTGRFGTITLTSAGGDDAFVAKWSPTANRFLWAVRGGGNFEDAVTAIAVSGNSVYVTGNLASTTATFGNTTLTNAGYTDVFIAKLTDAGNSASFSWVKQGASSGYDRATGLAVSGSNVYVVGQSNNALTVGGTAASSTGRGASDIFITKLTDAGSTSSVAWVLVAGGAYDDYAQAIAANRNQLYITGFFNGDTQLGSWSLPNASNQNYVSDTFVAKLVDAGTTASFAWAQRGGGTSGDGGYAIAVEGTSLYVAGAYGNGIATFGATSLPNAGQDDAYVAKLTDTGTSGNFVWAKTMGGSQHDFAKAIAARNGTVYVTGTYGSYVAAFGSSLLPNPYTIRGGSADEIFVTKLMDNGLTASFAWAQRAGGLSHDEAFALALAGNTIYVAGRTSGSATFPPLSFPTVAGQEGAYLASMTESLVSSTTAASATEDAFGLYPNPTHSRVEVTLPAAFIQKNVIISVLNTLGQVVKQLVINSQSTSAPVLLDLSELPAGLYLVRAQAGRQLRIQQLVLQ